MNKTLLEKIKYDLKNGTSHGVDFLLSTDVEKTLSERGIKIRKVFAPLFRMVYRTQSPYKLKKEPPLERKTILKKGKIFIVNHRQADDIVLGANAIGESGYIVFGNDKLALETINGWGLWAYGMILLDRNNEESRKASFEKMKYVLNHGGNIIIFSEGYWNLDDDGLFDERHASDGHNSENWLIQDLNIGAFRLAQETGCPIIPTVLHYDETNGKRCYSKKGTEFYVPKSCDIFEVKDELLEQMNTIYFSLMEKYSSYKREYLERNGETLKEQWENLKKELVSACDIPRIGYELDLKDEKLIGKAKVVNSVVTNEEAFKHLDDIEITKENAYLISKRLSGKRRR